MAICVTFRFPGTMTEQYDEACRNLNNGQLLRSLSDWPSGGCLSHVASATPEGDLYIVDVWESPEQFRAFGEELVPVLEKNGIPPVEPLIFPVHNFVT